MVIIAGDGLQNWQCDCPEAPDLILRGSPLGPTPVRIERRGELSRPFEHRGGYSSVRDRYAFRSDGPMNINKKQSRMAKAMIPSGERCANPSS